MEKAIALPFSIDPYGKVTITTDQRKIWADRVRSVVGTTIGERVMRPEFGGEVAFSVFNSFEDAERELKNTVTEVFGTQLPLLTLGTIETSYDTMTGTVYADISYSLPNDVETNTTIGIVYIAGNNPPIKENL